MGSKGGRKLSPTHKGVTRASSGIISGYHAYCSSDGCNPLIYKKSGDGKKIRQARSSSWCVKEVPRGVRTCPDCNYLLVWMEF
jgi:hypothetical protein